jgi:hypothetical protein
MRWKDIQKDPAATATAAPAGWAQELDRGIAEAMKGPTFPVSDVIADLDADLAEMANREGDIGHGETRPTRAGTNQQASSGVQDEEPSGSHPKSKKRPDPGRNSG